MDKEQAIEIIETHSENILSDSLVGRALNMAIDALKAQLSCEGTTSDTISRQAALNSPVTMVSEGLDWIPAYHIKELPSAQPEQLERCPIYDGVCGYPSDQCYDCPRHHGAQPEPQEGHWIDKGWDGDWAWQIDGRGNCWRVIECSECGKRVLVESNYCPNCGAHMKGATT